MKDSHKDNAFGGLLLAVIGLAAGFAFLGPCVSPDNRQPGYERSYPPIEVKSQERPSQLPSWRQVDPRPRKDRLA